MRHVVVLLVLGSLPALTACPGTAQHSTEDGSSGGCVSLPGCTGKFCCAADQLCASKNCEGKVFVCTQNESGGFHWVSSGGAKVACDDGNSCTENDLCVGETCLGVAATCSTPPDTACKDQSTLRAYAAQGTCGESGCEYTPTDTPCPQGCVNAQCNGDPCLGIKCDKPPSSCYGNPGTCAAGKCNYTTSPQGSSCSTGNPCDSGGSCDGQGNCTGSAKSCTAAHATGTCINGACQFTCSAGWGNCNSNWADGCEADLAQNGNCGTCGKTCSAAAHATASCSGGSCKLTCTSPYQDCDGNDSNGCEVPVGVANKCDKGGLGGGCGTAYCGSSSRDGAVNFGKWTCVFCEQCHHYSDGWSWCLFGSGETGNFSPARCASCCNSSWEDKVCPK
jgi:hypothetical protein